MIYEIIILILAIPVGLLIAWMARDELIVGRKWFVVLILFSTIAGFFMIGINQIIGNTLAFIVIVSLVSLWKSYDKKWVEQKLK